MCFWYYAFWYLFVGVCIDCAFSKKTRPGFWSIVLWPFILLTALFLAFTIWWGERD